MTPDPPRRLAAEAPGTGLLVATVVGSGVMADKLSAGGGVALLCSTIPTGAILVVLFTILGPVSGAHLNPAVTLVFALRKELAAPLAAAYVLAQVAGGLSGGFLARDVRASGPPDGHDRPQRTGQWLAEGVASFGLIATILGGRRFRPLAVPWLVGL